MNCPKCQAADAKLVISAKPTAVAFSVSCTSCRSGVNGSIGYDDGLDAGDAEMMVEDTLAAAYPPPG